MKLRASVLATLFVLATPALAQDRTDQPTKETPTGRTEEPTKQAAASAPKSDAERLEELEKKLAAQQDEIDQLKKTQKPPKVDEKGLPVPDAPPTFDWGFKDGFFVKGAVNGTNYELRPRARLQLDYRAFVHSHVNLAFPHSIPEDEFVIRRARVGFGGNFGPFEFTFDADPIRSPLPIADFWFQWHQIDEFQVRFGSYKAPFDNDDFMNSDLYIDCVERPMFSSSGNALAPDYRVGAMAFGKIAGGLFNYWVSCTNLPDSNTVVDGDPLYSGRVETDIKGFFLGVGALGARAGASGPNGAVKSFTGATPGQFAFFSPVNIRGWEQAYIADTGFYFGPTWIVGGYGWGQQERQRVAADGTTGTPLVTQGAYLTMGWMFWGPTTPGPHGAPFKDWDMFSMDVQKKRNGRNVGMELVCRVEWIDIRDARGGRRFSNGSETTPSVPGTAANSTEVKGNQAEAVTAGINFYPIENVKFMVDYVHLHLGDATRAERAHSHEADEFLVRAQLEF